MIKILLAILIKYYFKIICPIESNQGLNYGFFKLDLGGNLKTICTRMPPAKLYKVQDESPSNLQRTEIFYGSENCRRINKQK